MNLKLVVTQDGSHSLQNLSLNESYHSLHGALTESQHVFIENGLKFFCDGSAKRPVQILEIGFGTGLNALLAYQFAEEQNTEIEYTGIEAFPLPMEIVNALNYTKNPPLDSYQGVFSRIHDCRWGEVVRISDRFSIMKLVGLIQKLSLSTSTDVVFYDAFAPSKQAEMWELDVLKKVVGSMNTGGVFVTYCAKGQLKRDLSSLGLEVQSLEGPPGKKEMVRAIKTS